MYINCRLTIYKEQHINIKMGKDREKKDHESCQSLICAICYSESGLKAKRTVSDKEEQGIREYLIPQYRKLDERYPSGLCSPCQRSLKYV